MVYMKTMVVPLCCSNKSCIPISCADYELMADNTLFWPIIDFIGRHLSRARAENDEELHLRLTGNVVSSACAFESYLNLFYSFTA